MKCRTTRRSVLAASLTMLLAQRRGSAFQGLGKIGAYSALRWLPALPSDRNDWPISILAFADIAGYCEAAGVEQPRTFDKDTSPLWVDMGQRIPLNDGVLFTYLQEDWTELIGFSPMEVDRVAVAFDPPQQIRIYEGRFDPERIANQLADRDYDNYSVGEFTVLANPSADINLQDDLDRMSLGNFHHVAAAESMVIACRSAGGLDPALAVLAGDKESLATSAALENIGRVVPDLQGFLLLNGDVLASGPDGGDHEASIAPARLFLGGYTVDGDGQAVTFIADLGDTAAAEEAVPVIEDRIETQASVVSQNPYAELVAGFEVDVVPDTGLVRVTVPSEGFAMRWMHAIFARDLLFMATE